MPDYVFIPLLGTSVFLAGYFVRWGHERITRPRRIANAAWEHAYIKDARNLPITDR